MRTLICTQVLDKNDPVLGFFHRWVEEFAKRTEHVYVICLKEGEHDLPQNVEIFSLGKEDGVSRTKYILRFYLYSWLKRRSYDSVFVHMNSEYVLLGGVLWRLWGKRIGLWYVHKSVTVVLRCAVFFVHHVFTTSPESFRIHTNKRIEIGHGIDTELFVPSAMSESDILRIVTVGRVSATKRIAEMVEAVAALHMQGQRVLFTVVGEPVTVPDQAYERELRANVKQRGLSDFVCFRGAVLHQLLPETLNKADVFLNLSNTGSMDKAVLEALASGVPVVTSNEAFRSLLKPLGLFVSVDDVEKIALTLKLAKGVNTDNLVAYVKEYHDLPRLIARIVKTLSS